jgi:energy-coupling factor transporter ATP-binding protein EcfA2
VNHYRLNADELPNFTIITGPNGSGKTHLLRAIEGGNVWIDGQSKNAGAQARFFDSQSIVPSSTGTFSSQTLRNLRANTLGQLANFQNTVRGEMNQNLQGFIQSVRQTDPNFTLDDPLNLLESEIEPIDPTTEGNPERRQLIEQAKAFVLNRTTEQHLRNAGISPGLAKFANQRNISIARLGASDLETEAIDLWGGVNVFQQNLGQLFVAYRDMSLANSLKELEKVKTQRTDLRVFSDEDFLTQYGQSPW